MKKKFVSFRYRLLIGFILAAVVPVIISGITTIYASTSTLNRQAQSEAKERSESIRTYVDDLFDSYIKMARNISDSIIVKEGLDGTILNPDSDVYLEIYRLTENSRLGADYCLYDAEGKLKYSTSSITSASEMPLHWGALRRARDAEGEIVVYGAYGSGNECATVACMIYDDVDLFIGYCVIHIYKNAFSSGPLISGTEDSFILTDQYGYCIYSTSSLTVEDNELIRTNMSGDGIPVWNDSGSTLTLLDKSENTGFYLIVGQNAPMTGAARNVVIGVSLIVMAFCLILGLGVSALISRQLARPIGELSEAMSEVRGGNLDTRVEINTRDEIGALGESFNEMTADLDRYVRESVKRQQDLNDTQIRLLQTQLNPHFLYNTLDTIKWVSKLHNAPEAASLAENLAIILRRTVTNAPFVTLAAELDMLNSYVGIQQIRFSDKFNYVVDVPDDLRECLIPKLILQPLVENAIIHGLEDRDEGTVRVSAEVGEDGKLRLSVSDDGCGMPKEHLERINSPEGKMIEGHLGIYNVYQIIRLNYGDGYGMHAESAPDKGSTVTLTLPVIREGDGDIDKSRSR